MCQNFHPHYVDHYVGFLSWTYSVLESDWFTDSFTSALRCSGMEGNSSSGRKVQLKIYPQTCHI